MKRRFNRLARQLTSLSQQEFIRHNLVFLVGTLGIAFFNYLYYPVIGHLVSVEQFGEVQAWISLFMEFGIVLTAFGYVTTNIVRNHQGKSSKIVLLSEIERLALMVSVVLFLALWVSSYYLKSSFHFTSFLPFVALGALIVLNVPATFRTYYLQGEKRLKEVALSGIVFAAGKLLLSVVFILMSFKLFGVILGYILAQIANLYYVARKTRGQVPPVISSVPMKLAKPQFKTEKTLLKREVLFGLFVLVLLAIMTILYTSDAIVVRRFFSPHDAGLFSGITSIARIVFFVTASVAGVLIATVTMTSSHRENMDALKKSIALLLAIGGLVLVVLGVFSSLCVRILIGHKYVHEAYLLPWMGVSMLFASLNNLLFSYQIALRKYVTLVAAVAGILALVCLVAVNHNSLLRIAIDYVISNFIILIITAAVIYIQRSENAQTHIGSVAKL